MFCELRAVALAVARHVDLMPLRGLERLPRVERPAEQPRKRGGDRKPRDGAHGRAEGRAHTTRRVTHLDIQSRDDAALMLLGLIDVAQGHFLSLSDDSKKKMSRLASRIIFFWLCLSRRKEKPMWTSWLCSCYLIVQWILLSSAIILFNQHPDHAGHNMKYD